MQERCRVRRRGDRSSAPRLGNSIGYAHVLYEGATDAWEKLASVNGTLARVDLRNEMAKKSPICP